MLIPMDRFAGQLKRYAEWGTFPGENPGTFWKDAGQKLTISETQGTYEKSESTAFT
jgi:hypothetical protein